MENPITHIRGDTFSRSVAFNTPSGSVDLTGSTIVCTIKRQPEDSAPLVSSTLILTDPIHGLAQCTISATIMQGLDVGVYVYDFSWTDTNGNVKTVLRGPFEVVFDVTT